MYIITQGYLDTSIILGGYSAFVKFISSIDNYNGKSFYSADGINWTELSFDFFHKIYYETNPEPIGILQPVGHQGSNVGWDQGTSYGLSVNDVGQLTIDPKFISAIVVDDSASMVSSYSEVNYVTKLNSLYSSLVNRTNRTVDATTTSFTASDLWTFGTKISQKTKTGYTTNSANITTYLSALKRKGNLSELNDTLDIAMVGLSPQSIIDMIIKTGDTAGNILRVDTIRKYLESIYALRLQDIKDRYYSDTNKQNRLTPEPGSSTGTTIYLTLNGTTRYIWSLSNYPYSEVRVNNVIKTAGSDYTIYPTLGRIDFTSPITSSDSVVVDIREDWDGLASSIASNEDTRYFLVERWAKSYIPLLIAVVDGDNISEESIANLKNNLDTLWDDKGVKGLIFGTSASNNQINLSPIILNDGVFYQSTTTADWDDAIISLLHGGNKNIFKGYWNRDFEFNDPKYIKYVYTSYYAPSPSSVSVEFRYSTDKINYTNWITLSPFVNYSLNKEITNIQYRVTMTEGWTGSRVTPIIDELYHIEVVPSERYLFSDPYEIDSSLFQYILSSNVLSPSTSKLNWGICKGDSTDWEDYTPIINSRNGVLPNRQNSIQFTNEELYQNLPTTTSNLIEYQVLKDGVAYRWTDKAIIAVFVDGVSISSDNYSYDGSRGVIIFSTPTFSTQVITVSVRYPSERFFAFGESTTTNDYRTYYLTNGRWPADSNVVVLINGNQIARNTYYLNREDGTVTFYKEQSRKDLITVFIAPSGNFRIGVQILDYDDYVPNLYDFGLQYTTLPNDDVLAQYKSTLIPEIKDNLVKIDSVGKISSLGPSIEYRMYLDYKYYSSQNNGEKGTKTRWYRIRSGNTLEITPSNNLPEYKNRTVQRLADLNGANNYFLPGDQIYVEVEPSDGFKYGITYTSEIVTLRSATKPYVTDVQIKVDDVINDNSVSGSRDLNSFYVFYNGTDQSTINWYEWTNKTQNLIYTGSTLPKEYVSVGKVYSFIVTPFNGSDYGFSAESQSINIV